jgi:hypothetical protein
MIPSYFYGQAEVVAAAIGVAAAMGHSPAEHRSRRFATPTGSEA